MWWKNTEEYLPIDAKLLSLILYSDATNVDTIHEVEMKTQKSKCFDFGGQSRNEKSKWSK